MESFFYALTHPVESLLGVVYLIGEQIARWQQRRDDRRR